MTGARRRSGADDGFTLIEMLIAMTILGVIIVPLVSSFALGLGQTARSSQDITNSADAQLLASFFTTDVASAFSVATSGSCGTAGGAQTLLQFDNGVGATPRYVAYVQSRNSAVEAQLHLTGSEQAVRIDRVTCDSSNATLSSTLLVNSSASTTPPVLRCVPQNGGAEADCSGITTPQAVSIEISEWGSQPTDSLFAFKLKATRRSTA